jgi:pyridoxine/pyridoxamine 5'-phosphate oxidase
MPHAPDVPSGYIGHVRDVQVVVDELLAEAAQFASDQTLAVVATVGTFGAPQAALVGIAVSDRFELIFDSVDTSRKIRNLRHDPHIAVVIGGTMEDERTVQVDGVADEPDGDEGERIREAYFLRWPDGRGRVAWPGITHVRITPRWIRFSDWSAQPVVVAEWTRDKNGTLERA